LSLAILVLPRYLRYPCYQLDLAILCLPGALQDPGVPTDPQDPPVLMLQYHPEHQLNRADQLDLTDLEGQNCLSDHPDLSDLGHLTVR